MSEQKHCPKCNKYKNKSEFHKNASKYDGLSGWCKECNSKRPSTYKKVVRKSIFERLFEKVDKTDECWNWTGYKNKQGYGSIKVNDKMIKTHRLSYELFFGEIPHGLDVLHKCDNPSCLRPDHLFIGDDKANTQDSISKGRHVIPIANKKLTVNNVIEIRNKYMPFKYSIRKLAKEYKVSYWAIQSVLNRKNWKNV